MAGAELGPGTVTRSAQSSVSPPTGPAQQQSRWLRLGEPFDLLGHVEIYRPFKLVVAPDGSLVIIDFSTRELLKLTADGALIWRVGGPGQGPGEFRTLYRVDVGDDGRIVALDAATSEISWFSSDGQFDYRRKLPFSLRGIGEILLLPDDRVAVVGVARDGSLDSVRIFDNELNQVAAFGPLPPARNARLLEYWGAGGISPCGDNQLLFTLRIPYEIYHFDLDGTLERVIHGPADFDRGPDDAYIERTDGSRVGIFDAPEWVPYPLTAKSLGGDWIVSGVLGDSDEGSTWDLFYDGEFVESFPPPNGMYVAEVDIERGLIYVTHLDEDENKTYLRVPYSIVGPRRRHADARSREGRTVELFDLHRDATTDGRESSPSRRR